MTPSFAKLPTDKLVVRLRLARGDLVNSKSQRQRDLYGNAIATIRAELERRGEAVT